MATVDIILPVHGDSIYLAETIESIELQDMTDDCLLWIVCDRVSPSTDYFIQNYKYSIRHQVIYSPTIGLVDALNYGISKSINPLIARIDADDIMLPGRLRAQVEYLNENSEVGVVGGQIQIIDENGGFLGLGEYPSEPELVRKELVRNCCLAHPSVMMRRTIVEQVGGYRNFYSHAEDFDLWLRISEISQLANLRIPVIKYRQHLNQVSKLKRDSQIAASRAARESYKRRHSGMPDLIDVFASPDAWRLSLVGTKKLRNEGSVKYEHFKRKFVEARLKGEVGGALFLLTILFFTNPANLIRDTSIFLRRRFHG